MKRLINLAVIGLLFLSGTIMAQPGPNKRAGLAEGRRFQQLNLTAEQEKQMQDIRYQQQKNAIELRTQIQKNRLDIKHMMNSNNVDEKKLMDLTEANSKIQGQLKAASVKTWLEIYKILTPEQKEIWTKHFGSRRNNLRANFMRGDRGDFNGPRKIRMLNRENRQMGYFDLQNDEQLGMADPEVDEDIEK